MMMSKYLDTMNIPGMMNRRNTWFEADKLDKVLLRKYLQGMSQLILSKN
jgi:hypothetical protein